MGVGCKPFKLKQQKEEKLLLLICSSKQQQQAAAAARKGIPCGVEGTPETLSKVLLLLLL